MEFKINLKEEKEKSKQASSAYKVSPGLHLAKLVGIVELGTINGVRWIFVSFMTKDGGFIGTRMPESFTEHSRFTEMLYALLGSDLDQMEEVNFSEIINKGAFCYINVQEFETPDGRTGNRITEFAHAKGETFETNYRVYSYSIEDAIKNIDNLPLRWLKDSILQSDEWQAYQQQLEEKEVHFDEESERNPLEVPEAEVVEETAKVNDKKKKVAVDNMDDIDFGSVDLTEEERKKIREG